MLSRAVILGAVCLVVGWALILVSGYGGDWTGGWEWLWMVGGIMVYASMVILPVAALAALLVLLRAAVQRLGRHA